MVKMLYAENCLLFFKGLLSLGGLLITLYTLFAQLYFVSERVISSNMISGFFVNPCHDFLLMVF